MVALGRVESTAGGQAEVLEHFKVADELMPGSEGYKRTWCGLVFR